MKLILPLLLNSNRNSNPDLTLNGGITYNLFLMSKSEQQHEKFEVHLFSFSRARAKCASAMTGRSTSCRIRTELNPDCEESMDVRARVSLKGKGHRKVG